MNGLRLQITEQEIVDLINNVDVDGLLRRLLDNSRIRQLADCQLADWTTRGLDISLTRQLAD